MKLFLVCVLLCFTCGAFATIHTVTLSGLSFVPANITIQQGDTVRWVKTGGVHNVSEVSAVPIFRSGNPTGSPFTYDFAFNAPLEGLYNYQCEVHAASGMVGTVTVEAPAPCLTPEQVALKWEADDQVTLYWQAPQDGNYDIYATADGTHDVPPPGGGWTLLSTVAAVTGPAETLITGLVDQQFFVIIQNCRR
ncbi:MAG: hypothetical protein H6506_03915 [Calditrichaeota bacterium]|nr:hypothetical protein [Calditrichota bacterium]MCB9391780.1 hypothetical protein [Calditrichota bacterium]